MTSTDTTEASAWPQIAALIAQAPFPVEVAAPAAEGVDDLAILHLGDATTLGAMVAQTGGILLDHGWVRLLGSHSERLGRSLVSWNEAQGTVKAGHPPGLLIVGDDVLGGIFAINGGVFAGDVGMVFYFGPDSLTWESLNCGYTSLLHFLIGPGLSAFYGDHRWPGWESETQALAGDRAHFIYPPLFAKGPPLGERHRGAVPMLEMLAAHAKVLPELNKAAPALFPSLN